MNDLNEKQLDAIRAVRGAYCHLDRVPTRKEYTEFRERDPVRYPSVGFIYHHVGWSECLHLAGFEVRTGGGSGEINYGKTATKLEELDPEDAGLEPIKEVPPKDPREQN